MRYYLASSIVPQPNTIQRAPFSREDCDGIVFSRYYNEVSEHRSHETSFSDARRRDVTVLASNFSL
jgi:hypothetical protein